jgi:uncharacterized membrane protein YhhN
MDSAAALCPGSRRYFDIAILSRVSKPVLMPLVLLNALLALSDTTAPKWLGVLLTFALAFHCAGDVFLMIEGFPFFVTGLTCFLIGHLFYISIFFKKGLFKGDNLLWSILTGIAVIVIPLVLINVLEFKGPIKYAVFVYGIVLLFVSFSGLWGVFNKKSGASNPACWLLRRTGIHFQRHSCSLAQPAGEFLSAHRLRYNVHLHTC